MLHVPAFTSRAGEIQINWCVSCSLKRLACIRKAAISCSQLLDLHATTACLKHCETEVKAIGPAVKASQDTACSCRDVQIGEQTRQI